MTQGAGREWFALTGGLLDHVRDLRSMMVMP